MRRIAFIPARGGSKGLIGKNIRLLGGLPLIAHTINVARTSGLYDEIYVSTDDVEIADVGRSFGASVPALRPSNLAGDDTPMWDVLREAFDNHLKTADLITLLQPTSPFRTVENLHLADAMAGPEHLVCSVTLCCSHPAYAMTVGEDGFLQDYIQSVSGARSSLRQGLSSAYCWNGSVYTFFKDYFLSHNSFFEMRRKPLFMDKYLSVDIDDECDWIFAEALLQLRDVK